MENIPSWREDIRFRINADNLAIRADQTRARLRSLPSMVGSQLIIEPLLVALLWKQASHQGLLWWLGILILLHGAEVWSWWRYRSATDTIEQCRAWRFRIIVFTLTVGVMWGIAAACFFPKDFEYQTLLICVILGLAAGAVTLNPVYPPALYAYLTPILLPTIFRIAYEGDMAHWIIAAMLLLFTIVVLDSGRHLARTFYISLSQRYENISLVDQLTKEKSRAELASREKSRFLATASHDLRQPLQALMLFSEALHEVAQENGTRHLAGQIGKSVNALVEMFNELLDVSRLEAGIVEARWQHFALQPLLDRLYVDFAPLTRNKRLNFEMASGEWIVYSDPFLLDRILRNLISNAIRYTDQGAVIVRCTSCNEGLRFTVFDTGIGIGTEALPHIFEEYYQVSNPHRDRRNGLGLGLAIVHRVESLLGYKVEVESTLGKGSQFSFVVQLGNAAQQSMQASVVTLSRYDMQGVKVALVEDDFDIRQMLARLMGEWGCRVFEGEHAEDVMRKLEASGGRPDILVCDYRLPHGMTAVQVIKRLHELWGNDVPALVLTGDTAPEVLQNIRASGAMLLHKPIAPVRLRAMMYLSLHGES